MIFAMIRIRYFNEDEKMKINDRGFSLVELIVVLLIMAIVAVALAPQVVKWVENSRIASDLELKTDIEKACQFAITDEKAFEEVKDGDFTIVITKKNGNVNVTCTPNNFDSSVFWSRFFKTLNCSDFNSFKDSIEIKSTPVTSDQITMTIYVYRGGHTFSTLEGFFSTDIKIS